VNPQPGPFLKVTSPSRFCADCLAAMLVTSHDALKEALSSACDVEACPGRCDNCGDAVIATFAYRAA
jgi:hypothetical protein